MDLKHCKEYLICCLCRFTSWKNKMLPRESACIARTAPFLRILLFFSLVFQAVGLHLSPPELFAVAPMMGHTNRHWRYFFRLLSRQTWLYTEMLPATQVIAAYDSDACNAELLRFHPIEHPIAMQIGGHDVDQLAKAAAIAARLGYDAVNLNCGCPSNAVAGERGHGAALMREPDHVAACCEAMLQAIEAVPSEEGNLGCLVTVKHRLGIADAKDYDPLLDLDPSLDFKTAEQFIQSVSRSGVTRMQVHARKGLLGLHENEDLDDPEQNLAREDTKINHKRKQAKAKRRAREITKYNRCVPPLRPGVVRELAQRFPFLELVINGGVQSLDEVESILKDITVSTPESIHGVMVGRAVINHPCAFAGVDNLLQDQCDLLERDIPPIAETREQLIDAYISYLEAEEEYEKRQIVVIQSLVKKRSKGMETSNSSFARKRWAGGKPRGTAEEVARQRRRRALVAPCFNLFVGEEGCENFRRRLRKLTSRRKTEESYTAAAVLRAAKAEMSPGVLQKPLLSKEGKPSALPLKCLPPPPALAPRRSGAMQTKIY